MRPARTARSGFEMGGTWTSTCSGDQLEMVPADTEITQLDLDTSGMTMRTEIYLDGELMDLPDTSQDLLAASEAGGR